MVYYHCKVEKINVFFTAPTSKIIKGGEQMPITEAGESVNGYIKKAIDRRLESDNVTQEGA